MKKIGLIIFAVALVVGVLFANLISFGKISSPISFDLSFGKGVRGSGNIVTEQRDLTSFTSVDVSSVFQVELTAGKEFAVEIEADDNLVPVIKTEVVDGKLKLSTTQSIRGRSRMIVRISAPDIERVDVSGAAKVNVADIKNPAFTIDTSGASKVTVAGETSKLNISVSGASKVNAEQLRAENATVDASGASKINVNATNVLRADGSGASRIRYVGTPASIEKNTSGASSVKPMDQ